MKTSPSIMEGISLLFQFKVSRIMSIQLQVERKDFATETAVNPCGWQGKKEEMWGLGWRAEEGQAEMGADFRCNVHCMVKETAIESSGLWHHTGCLQQERDLYTAYLIPQPVSVYGLHVL